MLSADEIAEMAKGKLKRKVNQLVKALKGEANNILTLYSLFGGKTHTLITIYHAFRKTGF